MKTKSTSQPARTCPLCGETYHAVPAVSSTDSNMLICPDCGTRQALERIGVNEKEREKILKIIHRATHPQN